MKITGIFWDWNQPHFSGYDINFSNLFSSADFLIYLISILFFLRGAPDPEPGGVRIPPEPPVARCSAEYSLSVPRSFTGQRRPLPQHGYRVPNLRQAGKALLIRSRGKGIGFLLSSFNHLVTIIFLTPPFPHPNTKIVREIYLIFGYQGHVFTRESGLQRPSISYWTGHICVCCCSLHYMRANK